MFNANSNIIIFLKNHYFLLIFIFVANIAFASFYISPEFVVGDDAITYEEGVRFIEGKGKELSVIPYNRLLTTPLFLIFSSFVDFFLENPYHAIVMVNLLFYLIIIPVFYSLASDIFNDKKVALLSTIIFSSNYYLINISNLFLADMAGRFFLILTNLLAVKFYLKKENKYYYLAILSSSIGVLFKEFGGIGIISLGFLILLLDFTFRKRLFFIIKAAFLFLIVPLLFHIFFYFKFGFSYIDWYKMNINFYPPEQNQYGFILFIKVMGWLFLAGWPIFFWGLWKALKSLNKEKKLILFALLPASLSFFIWPMFMQRTAFVIVPWLSLLSGFGLSNIKNSYIVFVSILCYFFVGYNMERLLILINLPF